MNFKMVVVCLSIFILLFGIFSVSASDNTVNINDNLTNMESNTYDDIKVSNQNFDDGKLNAGNEYTFDDLQSKIDGAYVSGELNLDAGDFYNNTNSKAITISQTLIINGNGATISGATSFTVTGGNVVLKNIKYINSQHIAWNGANGTLDKCFFVNNSAYDGGAVYWNANDGTLMNCSFVNNAARNYAGAVYWNANNGTLMNCSFVNNNAKFKGGAVYWKGGYGVLGNCTFINSSSRGSITDYGGGAIFWVGVNGTLSHCSFVNNSEWGNGAVHWLGVNGTVLYCSFVNNTALNYTTAALDMEGSNSIVKFCSFVGNKSPGSGSALTMTFVKVVLSNCSFINNEAGYYGAAIFCDGFTGVIIENCSFVNNTAKEYGGAVHISRGSTIHNVVMRNCYFVNNVAGRRGGAVHWLGVNGILYNCTFINSSCLEYSSPFYGGGAVYWDRENGTLMNCSFVNNSGYYGGAVYWGGTKGVIGYCSFADNDASEHHGKGGAVNWYGVNGTLMNCSFVNNFAYGGDAVYWAGTNGVLGYCSFINSTGRGIIHWFNTKGVLSNCSFVNNSLSGLAVYWSGSKGVLSNCSFVNNTVNNGVVNWDANEGTLMNCSFVNNNATYGGAVYWTSSKGVLSNCSFVNNTAKEYGGAIYWAGSEGILNICSFVNNSGYYGGAVYWSGSKGVLDNCSFVNNNATCGGAVLISYRDEVNIKKSTFINNHARNGSAVYGNRIFSLNNCYFDGNLNAFGQGIYVDTVCNISNCRFDMTQIYINSGNIRLIGNIELNYQDNFTINYGGELFLLGNVLKSYIYNKANITSPVTMVALNNQTVKPSSNKIDITALIYDDMKNIIVDDDLRICVGSAVYNPIFNGVNYTVSDCDVPENKSVVSVKIQRSNSYTDITFKNGLLLPAPQNLTVNVVFNVVKNDVLMLFNVTPTSFNDNLTVFVANKEYSVKITDGRGNVSVRNLPADSYVMLVYYPENDEYNSYLHSFNFTVNLLPSQIYISVGDYYAGSDVIIGVNLTSGASGLPIIYVDNKKVDYTALGNINLGKLAYGNHTVSVIYASDKYYDSSFNMTDFLVKKNNSTISLNITDGSGDTSKNIIVEVTNGATGDVLIDVNGVVYRKSLSASKTTLILDDLKNGTYNVVVTYLGDEIYNSNSTSGSFEINATAPGNLTVNVTVIIDGKNYTGVIVDGVYHVDLSNATPGIYNATVIYRDSNNNLINTTMTFAVPKWDSNVDVKVFNIRMGEIETVVVNVTRGATGTVLIDVNGTAYYKILDNSRAELVLSNLKSGNYPVRVIYMGDDKYNNSTNRAEFIVGEGVVVSVFMDGKNPMLDVIVPQDAVGSVTVTINNKDYSGVVDNRHAIINISDVAPNTYNITTSYTNTSGSTVKGNATITVPKPLLIATVINVEYVSKDLMVTSVLKDINGNVLPNQEITYSMNGVINKTTTDRDGLFKVKYVSNSTLYIEYAGNNIYEGSNTTIVLDKFVDLRNATKIISEVYDTYAVDFELGERGGYFKFRLVDDNGNPLANKPVQIGFCGVVYNRVTDSEGNAQLQINLNTPFIFTFAIAFLGDDTHNASFVVQQINVAKKTTSISADSKSYKASEKTKKFTVTLKSDKCSSIDGKTYLGMNKKITLKLNGKTYTAKTNMRNQAIFKLDLTKKGSYNAEIRFEGDGRYAASKTTAKIKIV